LRIADGHAILSNTNRRITIASHHFKGKIRDAAFSPNGKWILVALDRTAQIWKTPGCHREFAPFILHRTYTGHFDDIVKLTWRPDSRYLLLHPFFGI
jgi:periodic tryptophan protein 2